MAEEKKDVTKKITSTKQKIERRKKKIKQLEEEKIEFERDVKRATTKRERIDADISKLVIDFCTMIHSITLRCLLVDIKRRYDIKRIKKKKENPIEDKNDDELW